MTAAAGFGKGHDASSRIAVSIVSHGHGAMVTRLVTSLLDCPEVVRIIVTLNIPEVVTLPMDGRIQLIENPAPQGFGVNHNAAFSLCRETFFCPMNPDIRLAENPFPALLNCMATTGAALVAPRVLEADGRVADSMRGFPTVPSMVRKLLLGDDGRYAYASDADFCHPDWVAGMFMLFRHECFDALRGFDERFFMYYEDVDVCLRTWQAGMSVTGCLTTAVTHDARRSSHRNWRHLRWHLASMLRFFLRYPMPQRVRRCGPGAA